MGCTVPDFQRIQRVENHRAHLFPHGVRQRRRLHMAGLYVHGGTGGKFQGDLQQVVGPLVGDALHAVLLAGGKLLHQRHLLKTLFTGADNGRLQPRRALHLGNTAAAGTVGGFDDQRILHTAEHRKIGFRADEHRTGRRVARGLKCLPHFVLVGGLFAAAHSVARQPHFFGHVIDGYGRKIAGNGADSVNADLPAFFQNGVFLHNADGIKMVRHLLSHIVRSPGKHMGLAAHILCFLNQRRLQVGRANDCQSFHPFSFLLIFKRTMFTYCVL